MNNLKQVIMAIGEDVGVFLNNSITTEQAKILIAEKLKNNGDPFVTRSKLPTVDTSQLASKNDLEELKHSVGAGSGASTELKGQGFPYALNADIGTIYTDTTAKNGAVKWIKKTAGTGSNAWGCLVWRCQIQAKNFIEPKQCLRRIQTYKLYG